jgi:hypothetical protein
LGIIGVNTPFLPRSPLPPIELMRAAMGPEHYIVHFQTPGDADLRLARDVRRVFDRIMRKGIKLADLDLSRGCRTPTAVESTDLLGQPLPRGGARGVRSLERTASRAGSTGTATSTATGA